MGFLSSLLGKDQAKASREAASIEEAKDTNAIDKILEFGGDFRDAAGDISEIFNANGGGGESFEKIAELLGLRGEDRKAAAVENFRSAPGFKFAIEEGEKAALRSAEAGGRTASGRTLKELQRVGIGTADQTAQQFINNLFNLGDRQSSREQFAQGGKAQTLLTGEQGRFNAGLSAFGARLSKPSATAQGLVAAETAKAAGAQNILNAGATVLGSFLGGKK